ncbi:hypothetical protein CHUV2995_02367 [Corynebacterium diphtheriae subsp. lausannense]|nr:hypothetical protein CHUV2995_02367 [Corynebacterium diphtheriae subsp. lausannense]
MQQESSLIINVAQDLGYKVKWAGWLVVTAFTAFFILDWIATEAYSHNVTGEYSWRIIVHIFSLFVTAVLLEQFFPIKSISPTDWVYKVQPSQEMRLNIFSVVSQILSCTSVGLVVGTANGHIGLYSAIAAILRIAPLILRKDTIPKLLSAGRTKIVTQASGVVLDSEIIHAAVATTHLRWIKIPPTTNYAFLTFARIIRKPYLILFGLAIVLLPWSLVQTLPVQSCIFFLLCWAVLGGAVARCADFSRLEGSVYPKSILLFVYSLLAAVVFWLIYQPSHPLIAAMFIVPTVVWCGWTRSKKRFVEQLSFIETGVFGAFSPEQMSFYLTGLFPIFLASVIISSHAI